jgi:hypothetical protein
MVTGRDEKPFGPSEPTNYPLGEFVTTLGFSACISTTAFRRDLYDRVGGFDPASGYLLDFDFFVRIAAVSGLSIRALGHVGGVYYADRGTTWARLESTGEAKELFLRWIELRESFLGAPTSELARRALGMRARVSGRAHLVAKNDAAACRDLEVAAACARGRERLENRALAATTRLSPTAARAALALYGRLGGQ